MFPNYGTEIAMLLVFKRAGACMLGAAVCLTPVVALAQQAWWAVPRPYFYHSIVFDGQLFAPISGGDAGKYRYVEFQIDREVPHKWRHGIRFVWQPDGDSETKPGINCESETWICATSVMTVPRTCASARLMRWHSSTCGN